MGRGRVGHDHTEGVIGLDDQGSGDVQHVPRRAACRPEQLREIGELLVA
ncbi:hypothetical protein AB0D57_33105 [Streptomyces sp. NPDC048275]